MRRGEDWKRQSNNMFAPHIQNIVWNTYISAVSTVNNWMLAVTTTQRLPALVSWVVVFLSSFYHTMCSSPPCVSSARHCESCWFHSLQDKKNWGCTQTRDLRSITEFQPLGVTDPSLDPSLLLSMYGHGVLQCCKHCMTLLRLHQWCWHSTQLVQGAKH